MFNCREVIYTYDCGPYKVVIKSQGELAQPSRLQECFSLLQEGGRADMSISLLKRRILHDTGLIVSITLDKFML